MKKLFWVFGIFAFFSCSSGRVVTTETKSTETIVLGKLTPKQITERNYQEVIGDLTNSTDTISPDKYAMYPDGIKGVLNHISKNLTYPRNAASKGIQGKVILRFVVEKDGTIGKIKVIQSVDPELDAEAIRVVKKITDLGSGVQRWRACVNLLYISF